MIEAPAREDVQAIIGIVERAGVFGRMDVDCVKELLEDYFRLADHGGYHWLVYRQEGRVVGMACYGPAPLTEGTFDLYWLATDPQAQRTGVGRALIETMESDVRQKGGRLIVVETSGTEGYAPARAFYLSRGYHRQATIPDFYAPGDDLVIYVKRLH
jgi:ribosomal protein S18 acetylase RimI-like enzyme